MSGPCGWNPRGSKTRSDPRLADPQEPDGLALDADFAEAQDHAAPGRGSTKAHLRPEAREQEHLVKLPADAAVLRAGEDLVADHFALGVHRGLDQQRVRTRQTHFVTFHLSRERKRRQALQPRRLEQVGGQIVRHGAERHTRGENLVHHCEHQERGHDTACSWQRHRLQDVLQDQAGAGPQARGPALRGAHLRDRYLDAHSQVGRGSPTLGARHQRGKFAVALQFIPATSTILQVLAHRRVFAGAQRAVQIAWQLASNRPAGHLAPHPGNPARSEPREARISTGAPSAKSARGARAADAAASRVLAPFRSSTASKAARSARRPRRIRDFTVPTEMSNTSATSSYDNPSRSRRITALRKASGTARNPRWTS